MDFPLNPQDLSREIEIPLEDWPGNCHAIASAVLQMTPVEGMRLARGHFTGYVSRKSVYRSAGVQQHSWLVAADGRILDPTRWAMDRPDAPYIYLGDNDAYDEAGLEISLLAAPPLFPVTLPEENMLSRLEKPQLLAIAQSLSMGFFDPTSPTSIRWLAESVSHARKAPPEHLDDAPAFYGAMRDAGLKSLIKIDLWTMVMDPQVVTIEQGANRWFELPAAQFPTPAELFFDLCCKFISVEARDIHLENELEEFDYTLDEWHDALNQLEFCIKKSGCDQGAFGHIPKTWFEPLVVVSSDLLGKGYSQSIRIERHAHSRGYNRAALNDALIAAGDHVGYDLNWI